MALRNGRLLGGKLAAGRLFAGRLGVLLAGARWVLRLFSRIARVINLDSKI